MQEAVIVSAARTAIGKAGRGTLAHTRPEDMGATAVKEAIDRVKQVRPIALTATGWEQFAADVLEVCEIST